MALKRQKPVFWPPVGLSDALDGTDDFKGACSLLSNLIPAPNNGGMQIARPAAVPIPGAGLPDYGGGPVTALATVGNVAYGMYASAMFSGKDRPFAYNMVTGAFASIAGLSSANLPATQPATGDWTPPTVAAVGSRILFTHPGFPDGSSVAPYYNTFSANTAMGSPNLLGVAFAAAGGLPAIAPGQVLFGVGIPVGTTVLKVFPTTGSPAGTVVMSQNATAPGTGVTITAISPPTASKFGWLDISSFSLATFGNTINGQPVLTGNPTTSGVEPGMTVSGTGIPAGTIVQAFRAAIIQAPNCTFTMSSTTVTLPQQTFADQITVGMVVAGAGIPIGTTVTAITTVTVTLSQNTTAAGPATLTFSGAFIIISANGTATANGIAVTIAGGSAAAPLWGAGDTNINPLAAAPVFVAQFSGRAYFGVNTTNPSLGGVTASDSGIPCQVTNANQIITFSDGVLVTAAMGLGLANQLGGVIQSLMVFQGASNIRQITGDFALGTWSENALETATGTLSPNSIAKTPNGLLFAAPDGLRLIDFDANISEPIGTRGTGIVIPFINSVTPSRAAAAYNENVYRITLTWQPPPLLQLIYGSAQRTDEFWFHLDIQKFSGPHTSTMDLVAPWQTQNSFICAPSFGRGALWRSDTLQSNGSTYIENGLPLMWSLRTVLLPDDPSMFANRLTESTAFASMSAATQWLASMIDDQGQTLDQAYVWLGPNVTQSQLPIYWENPIVFRQAAFQLAGNSEPQTLIGTIELRYQKLKYQVTFRPVSEFVLDQSILGGPDVLGP